MQFNEGSGRAEGDPHPPLTAGVQMSCMAGLDPAILLIEPLPLVAYLDLVIVAERFFDERVGLAVGRYIPSPSPARSADSGAVGNFSPLRLFKI
jgi:hypothetical protein